MSDRLAKLQAERAALEAGSGQKAPQNPPPWGEEGAALYAAIGAQSEKRGAIRICRKTTCRLSTLRTSIVNIEAGRQRLTIDTLYDIADALKIQAVSLMPRNGMYDHPTPTTPRATAADLRRSAAQQRVRCVWCERAQRTMRLRVCTDWNIA